MTPLIVVLLTATVLVTLVRRPRRQPQGGRWWHRRAAWLLARHRRRVAEDDARQLLAALLRGGQVVPVAHLAAGVVLQPGEVPWGIARARLAVHTTASAWITRTRVSWWGRRAETVGQQRTFSGWSRRGRVDWLLTSHRVAGRLPGTGELISIWWSNVDGLEIDLRRSLLALQTTSGWRARIYGLVVAPIGVAAVAGCFGIGALQAHPSLGSVRDS